MKKVAIKVLTLVLVIATIVTCAVSLSACSSSEESTYIGIIKYVNHPSLNDCYDGIIEGLKEGLGEDFDKYTIDLQDSNGEPSTSAAQANAFVSKNARIIGAIATPSAMAANAAAQGTIPVVYCAVSNPEKAGLTTSENVTGSSDVLDFDSQLALIKKFIPTVSKIGVLRSTDEVNSTYQVEVLKEKAAGFGITVVDKAITDAREIATQTDALISEGVDCITNLTDNKVVNSLGIILEKTNAAGIPVFGSEIDQVTGGCLASASLDYKVLGKETGLLMAKIIKGEIVASNENAIQVKDSFNCYSKKVADALGIAVPEGAGKNVDAQD